MSIFAVVQSDFHMGKTDLFFKPPICSTNVEVSFEGGKLGTCCKLQIPIQLSDPLCIRRFYPNFKWGILKIFLKCFSLLNQIVLS